MRETVVKTIIALGRELDMRVTVEGVETAEQAAFLDELHADQVQGFFFGRPGTSAGCRGRDHVGYSAGGIARYSHQTLADASFDHQGQDEREARCRIRGLMTE